MPEVIVDGLEIVEVDEEQRQIGAVVVGVGDLVLQAHVEIAAVEQARSGDRAGPGRRAQASRAFWIEEDM